MSDTAPPAFVSAIAGPGGKHSEQHEIDESIRTRRSCYPGQQTAREQHWEVLAEGSLQLE